jgi:hypothetical protein
MIRPFRFWIEQTRLAHVLSIPLGFHSLSMLFVDAACEYAFSLRERREVITTELLVIKRELLVSSLSLSHTHTLTLSLPSFVVLSH